MVKKLNQLIETTIIHFLNENTNMKNPIIIKSKSNTLFFIKIYFDNDGRVNKIENKWDINLPAWDGLKLNMIEINNWINKVNRDFYIENDGI